MRYVVAAGAVALMLLVPSVDASEWIKLESPNFELYTTAGERDARETLSLFEQVRDFFMRVKSQSVTTTLPVTIVGFRNAKEYKPYQPNDATAAYYNGDEQRDYIVMGSLGGEISPIAIHEYMHLLVRHAGLNPPVWLNEGFAELYSTLKPAGGQIMMGTPPLGRAIALGQMKWIPLPKLLSITSDSPEYNEKDRAGVLYAQSWLLVHMLALSDEYRDGFPKFVTAVRQLSDAEPAFESVYHKKLWEVELDLRNYYQAKRLNAVLFKTRFEKVQTEHSEAAAELEVGVTLAKLKSLLRRYDEAEAQLSQLATAHPESAEVEEAMAYLCWRQDHRDEALKHFSRATSLKGTDWKTYWDYARLLGPGTESYPEALRKAISLKPDLIEARLVLGGELVRKRSWAQALATLGPVKNVDSEHAADLFLLLAYCDINLDLKQEGKTNAASARKYAKDARRQQEADRLIAFLDGQEAAIPAKSIRSDETPGDESGPQMLRKSEQPAADPADAPAPRPKSSNVKGNLKRLDCLGVMARMHVMDGRETFVLLIRDPVKVELEGGAAVELKCGPQNASVSVDYTPGNDEKLGTAGEVRKIEFIN